MKKIGILIAAGVLMTALLSGCGSSSGSGVKFTDTTIQGSVTEIDGTKITFTMGGMGMPSGRSAPSGDMPDMPQDSGDDRNTDAAPPGNMGSEISSMTAELTVDKNVTVKIQDDETRSEGSLSDIAANSTISITFDADGNVTEITVMNMQMDKNGTTES